MSSVLGGEIVFDAGARVLDCLVADISMHGCHLRMSDTSNVPDRFLLRIRQDGREMPVSVRSLDTKNVQVEFAARQDAASRSTSHSLAVTPETRDVRDR